jgi:hypothetical protein
MDNNKPTGKPINLPIEKADSDEPTRDEINAVRKLAKRCGLLELFEATEAD